MIRVTVELLSAISADRNRVLAVMDLSNDGVATIENPNVGNYLARAYRGRDREALSKGSVQKQGVITGWRRNDFHVWNLVRAALTQLGYTKGQPA